MHKSIENKIELIKSKDMDGSLIFKEPSKEFLYTISELKMIFNKLIGKNIPSGLTIVQRKHWLTYEALKLLGYKKPEGLRTKEARESKPKFRNQMMDIFVQKHNNLQVWNYIPYIEKRHNCRYIIFKVDDEKVLGLIIKTGKELKDWDVTGTKTIKWQAIVTDKTRKKASNKILLSDSDPIFSKFNFNKKNLDPIEKRIENIKKINIKNSLNCEPNPKFLITINELENLLKPILGIEIEPIGEKLIGQKFQGIVAEKIGYTFEEGESIDSGQFPDMLHQLIETKIQISPTIDLGFHLPISKEPLNFNWNKNQITTRDIRYIIAIANKTDKDKVKINGIVITSGNEFEKFFSLCEGTNFKVQMIIPNFNSI